MCGGGGEQLGQCRGGVFGAAGVVEQVPSFVGVEDVEVTDPTPHIGRKEAFEKGQQAVVMTIENVAVVQARVGLEVDVRRGAPHAR